MTPELVDTLAALDTEAEEGGNDLCDEPQLDDEYELAGSTCPSEADCAEDEPDARWMRKRLIADSDRKPASNHRSGGASPYAATSRSRYCEKSTIRLD